MRGLRRLATGLLAVAMIGGWLLLAPPTVGGSTTYVSTHGISMEPRFHTGDLALVRHQDSYQIGDVVAYHSPMLHVVVLHRVVDREGASFILKGDNNSWLDPQQIPGDALIGKLAFRIPKGGVWLKRLASPAALGLMGLAMMVGGGGAVETHRRRKRGTVARHAARASRSPVSLAPHLPQLQTAMCVAAGVIALGLALGAVSWSKPVQALAPKVVKVERSMTFSYLATVAKTPAYDGTTVRSPDTVFRRLVRTVDVRFAYKGEPGSVAVNAELSTASGWHSVLPLAASKSFAGAGYQGVVRLDLGALERRAQAAAAVTGLPADQLSITVVPRVASPGRAAFEPALKLTLSPLEVKLADGPAAMSVKSSTQNRQATLAPRLLTFHGRTMPVATGRWLSAVLVLGGLLVLLAMAMVARRTKPGSESAAIRRRYAQLLVAVHPMPTPAGRPVVDVTEFATLVKLAERYGLLVMHWSRSDVETFVLQDEGTTFRYRTGTGAALEQLISLDNPH